MIRFENGNVFDTQSISGKAEFVASHKRDVLSIVAYMTYNQAFEEFNGQSWSILEDGNVYDRSNYSILASICDNLDGTCTIRIGRKNTREEDLEDLVNTTKSEVVTLIQANESKDAEIEALNIELDNLVVEILSVDVIDN